MSCFKRLLTLIIRYTRLIFYLIIKEKETKTFARRSIQDSRLSLYITTSDRDREGKCKDDSNYQKTKNLEVTRKNLTRNNKTFCKRL